MAQVVTPPAAGDREEAGKNWYRAEALRQVHSQLVNVLEDIPERYKVERRLVTEALTSINAARLKLSPPPTPAKQAPPVRY